MREQIALLGNYGHRNLGDEAILAGFVAATRRVRPDLLPILVFSDDPADTSARAQSEEVRPRRLRRPLGGRAWRVFGILGDVVASLRRCRHLVLAGGGLINDSNPTSLLLYTAIVRLAPLTGTRVHAVAISIGPLDKAWSRTLARLLLGGLATVAVRDADSLRAAQALGRRDATWIPDAALAMDAAGTRSPVRAVHDGPWTVAVSVIPLGKPGAWYESNPAEYEQYLHRMTALVTALVREQGARVILLPINVVHDSAVGAEILGRMSPGDRRYCELLGAATVEDVLGALAGADVLVACRLHSAVLATVAGRPFVTLAYQNKVRSYAADVGLGGLVADVRWTSAQECMGLLADCRGQLGDVSRLVAKYAEGAAPTFDAGWKALLDQMVPKNRS